MTRPDRLPLLLPLAVLFVAGAWGLVQWPLWRAELWTWMLVGLPWSDFVAKLAADFHPPGYFGLLWLFLDERSPDWLLRFPSLLGALGAVALTGWAGRRWYGEAPGSFAALALALSPFVIVYAGVARGYALLAFACAGLLAAAAEIVAGRRYKLASVGLFAAGTYAIYVHYAAAAALVATALGIAAGLRARPDRGARRWAWAVGAMALAGLAFAPWVLGPMRAQQVDVARLPRTLEALGYLLWPVGHQQPVANWALLALGVVGIGALLRRRKPVDRLLLAWPLCGVVIPLVFSDRSDFQTKYYIQSWFLPAWGLLVGLGAAALVRRVASFRVGAGVFAGALVASALGPLIALWRLPAAPFEVLNGSTVYDVRKEAEVLGGALPSIPVGSFPPESFSIYARYFRDIPMTEAGWRWTYRHRMDSLIRSVYTPPESDPCTFVHAFFVVLTVPDPGQCAAIIDGIVAAVEDDPYPPFLLEIAARERMRGDFAAAEAFAQRAEDVPTGWSDPTVFLAQLRVQTGQLDAALAGVEAGIERSLPWRNYFVTKELFSIEAELLRRAGREAEAGLAAQCALPQTPLSACLAEWEGRG